MKINIYSHDNNLEKQSHSPPLHHFSQELLDERENDKAILCQALRLRMLYITKNHYALSYRSNVTNHH